MAAISEIIWAIVFLILGILTFMYRKGISKIITKWNYNAYKNIKSGSEKKRVITNSAEFFEVVLTILSMIILISGIYFVLRNLIK